MIEAARPAPAPAKEADVSPPAVDFVAILEAAGVDAEQRSMVERAQELLRTLPADTPRAVGRGIVEAAFRAFRIPTEKIISATSNEIDALKAYIRASEEKTKQILADGAKQVAELERKIAEVKASMARSVAEQQHNIDSTEAELLDIEPVLGFFQSEQAAATPSKPPKKEKEEKAAGPAASKPPPQRPQEDSSVEIQWEPGHDGG